MILSPRVFAPMMSIAVSPTNAVTLGSASGWSLGDNIRVRGRLKVPVTELVMPRASITSSRADSSDSFAKIAYPVTARRAGKVAAASAHPRMGTTAPAAASSASPE
jgi:hypothetical protein